MSAAGRSLTALGKGFLSAGGRAFDATVKAARNIKSMRNLRIANKTDDIAKVGKNVDEIGGAAAETAAKTGSSLSKKILKAGGIAAVAAGGYFIGRGADSGSGLPAASANDPADTPEQEVVVDAMVVTSLKEFPDRLFASVTHGQGTVHCGARVVLQTASIVGLPEGSAWTIEAIEGSSWMLAPLDALTVPEIAQPTAATLQYFLNSDHQSCKAFPSSVSFEAPTSTDGDDPEADDNREDHLSEDSHEDLVADDFGPEQDPLSALLPFLLLFVGLVLFSWLLYALYQWTTRPPKRMPYYGFYQQFPV